MTSPQPSMAWSAVGSGSLRLHDYRPAFSGLRLAPITVAILRLLPGHPKWCALLTGPAEASTRSDGRAVESHLIPIAAWDTGALARYMNDATPDDDWRVNAAREAEVLTTAYADLYRMVAWTAVDQMQQHWTVK